ncbi:ATP-binding protein [Streptomyces deccanensis]|uniref:ATP-binding protein n=1 Tax=Streptomyces deccanensis TaxID=424188 RepID=UPI001EFB4BE3|nr:ATP-binding protein [Streptomyces deccanensis]ULR50927.1 ATP-binding protein [Streptomyces deccanensis]
MERFLCAMLFADRYAAQSFRYGWCSACVAWVGGVAVPGYKVTEPQLRCVLPFEAEATEVSLLRKAATAQLSQWGMTGNVEEVALLVTELATNVLKHVGDGSSATLILEAGSERLRVEVHDQSRVIPSPKTADCDEECGRGLHLLAALALNWGADQTAGGKAVWCEVLLDPARECRRIARAVGALADYRRVRGGVIAPGGLESVGLEASAVELIADLLHWTASRGCDPDDILDLAQMHYEAEVDAA